MSQDRPRQPRPIPPEVRAFAAQVRSNCRISDAKHAGLFSICGLALRLRDLYKWEKGLPAWQEREPAEVLEWIGRKEEDWEAVSELDFSELSLFGTVFDPFDTRGVNRVLAPYGVFYGAGYARSLKPAFFLAGVEQVRRIDGTEVIVVGSEYARDLLTLPALNQDGAVVLRKEAARLFLWDQMLYLNASGKPAFDFALEAMGMAAGDSGNLRRCLPAVLENYEEAFVYHELGEMSGDGLDPSVWRQMIAAYPNSPVELLARTLKDLLADTCPRGTLRHLVDRRMGAALGLYVAFFSGLAKAIFPELRTAFSAFCASGDWRVMENAVAAGYENARSHADLMVKIFKAGVESDDADWARREMETRMLDRLQNKGAGAATDRSPSA